MKVTLLFTGKTADNYMKEGIGIYTERLKRYVPVEIVVIRETARKSKSLPGKTKIREKGKTAPSFEPSSCLVLLDEKGEQLTSEGFAGFIEKIMNRGYREIVFATGGAYGFSSEFYNRADFILSLSGMTFTHQMVRLILAEQLYRAMTIIRGEPYHHG